MMPSCAAEWLGFRDKGDVIGVSRADFERTQPFAEHVFETAARGRALKKADERTARAAARGPCSCGHPASKHPGGGACAHFARGHYCPCVLFRATGR
jgi:hypothetical protein